MKIAKTWVAKIWVRLKYCGEHVWQWFKGDPNEIDATGKVVAGQIIACMCIYTVLFVLLLWAAFIVGNAIDYCLYILAICGEAVFPDLSSKVLKRLVDERKMAISADQLDLTERYGHLLLLYMSALLLFAWGAISLWTFMDGERAPWFVRIYVLVICATAFGPSIWSCSRPEVFCYKGIGKRKYIWFISPPMYNTWMSYTRILLAILTLGLPFLRYAVHAK